MATPEAQVQALVQEMVALRQEMATKARAATGTGQGATGERSTASGGNTGRHGNTWEPADGPHSHPRDGTNATECLARPKQGVGRSHEGLERKGSVVSGGHKGARQTEHVLR